ncbi:MAG: endonuclease [Lachnospiraceae bacterium]|nr:endonuclease [Lachnospiraceae bacterium]
MKKAGIGKFLKILLIIILVPVIGYAGILGWLTAVEWKPKQSEAASFISCDAGSAGELRPGDEQTMMTWNIGYGALGDNADFVMDGGKMVNTADAARLEQNLGFIEDVISDISPDFLLVQEIDRNSYRSHGTDECVRFTSGGKVAFLNNSDSLFAYNFRCPFVPFPVPPIGKVNSGIFTASVYPVSDGERIALPSSFKWPVRIANLKRCLLVAHIPVADSDKMLTLINLHLEAYDSGEGKIAQTRLLTDILDREADSGNYIIAGGDFNQIFSGVDNSAYPVMPGTWECGYIDEDDFDPSYSFYMDNSVPSCRSLDRPLSDAPDKTPAGFQYYVIDGFIVSDNIRVESVETRDYGFKATDHNPVVMTFALE